MSLTIEDPEAELEEARRIHEALAASESAHIYADRAGAEVGAVDAAEWDSEAGTLPWEREPLSADFAEFGLGYMAEDALACRCASAGEGFEQTASAGFEAECEHEAERAARLAAHGGSSAVSQGLIGAITIHLFAPVPSDIRALAPVIVGLNAKLACLLRDHPLWPHFVLALPGTVRGTRDILVRRARAGRRLTPRVVRRVHGARLRRLVRKAGPKRVGRRLRPTRTATARRSARPRAPRTARRRWPVVSG